VPLLQRKKSDQAKTALFEWKMKCAAGLNQFEQYHLYDGLFLSEK
jgi:hypothetical protein